MPCKIKNDDTKSPAGHFFTFDRNVRVWWCINLQLYRECQFKI
jgi:hypothetical protein